MSASNNITLIGTIAHKKEIKTYGDNGKLLNFQVSVRKRQKDENGKSLYQYINMTAFGALAEFVDKNFHAGNPVSVNGELDVNSVKNEDGTYTNYTSVICGSVDFVPSGFEPKKDTNTSSNTLEDTLKTAEDGLPF